MRGIAKKGRPRTIRPVGRPSEYTPEIIEKTREFYESYEPWFECPVEKQDKTGDVTTRMERIANPPPDFMDLAKHLGVTRWTVWNWQREHEEFSNVIKEYGGEVYSSLLQKNALLGNYSQPFAIFAAKNRLGWTDKAQLEHSGTIEHIVRLPAKKEEGSNVE